MDEESRREGLHAQERERPPRRRVEDLEVFKLAHDLALSVYRVSESFELSTPSLVNDLRRAAVAVPANLAEGASRATRAEYQSFVSMAQGTAAVVSYYLLLAKDLGHLGDADCQHLREGYGRAGYMLSRFAQSMS